MPETWIPVVQKVEQEALQVDQQVLTLQMDALYEAVPAAVLSIFAASGVAYIFWSPATSSGLSLWLVWMVAIAVMHISAGILRSRHLPPDWTDASWARVACFIYANAGLSWGLLAALLIGQSTDHQIIILYCVVVGAVMVTFPIIVYTPAYNLFQMGALLPLALGFATTPMDYNILLAGGCIFMAAFGTLIGFGMGGQLVSGMRASIENRRLVMRLEERGAALEAANRELEQLSLTDALTGLANRRRLMSFARAIKGRCALLVIDVDHFKAYNDSFGHVEGDACLVAVAAALQKNCRPGNDIAARIGGEEFAVVITDVTESEASAAAEKIRMAIEDISTRQPSPVRRTVTVSVGLAYRGSERYRSVAELMAIADSAAYRAKRDGRNLVRSSTDDTVIALTA